MLRNRLWKGHFGPLTCTEFIYLTGDEKRLKPLVSGKAGSSLVEIVHAPEVITMEEAPVEAVRKKKQSSLVAARNWYETTKHKH